MRAWTVLLMGLALSVLLGPRASCQVEKLKPSDEDWILTGEARIDAAESEPVVYLRSGRALRPDLLFDDGTIEFEMLPTDRRAFLGVVFRAESGERLENIYFRLHKSQLPDAIQYSPDYGGRGQWQLYHGPTATAAAHYAPGVWQRVRIEVKDGQAAVFVGEGAEEPDLVVDRLRSGAEKGIIGFWGNQPGAAGSDPPSALLRGIVIRHGETSFAFPEPTPEKPVRHVVRHWGVSSPFIREENGPRELPAQVLGGEWREVSAEPSGLLPLDLHVRPEKSAVATVLVGLWIHAEAARLVWFDLGFSDDVVAFLNDRAIYSGRSGFSTNFPRRQGLITLDQASLPLSLEAGENRLVLSVSEVYGGWGVMGRIEDREGLVVEPMGPARRPASPTAGIEFRGGRWYDGSGFVDEVRYAVAGLLTSTRPDRVTRIVDLGDGYVIPPFGEAHNHRPDGWPGTERHVAQFLEHGIFYVMNPSSFPAMTRTIEGEINRPASVDMAFSNGGLTAPGTHVTALYERNLERGVFPEGWNRERLDGEGFFIIRDRADLEARWPAVLAGRPDFVKIFMGFSEDYEMRHADPAFEGMRGIDPALVPGIVERAHRSGLRVAAHIETAEDFRRAVAGGVDIMAHMPGSWRLGQSAGYEDESLDRWLLSEEDAAAASRRDVAVVAHVFHGSTSPDAARIHAHNLELLEQHGVRLAIGSDSYRTTSLREAVYLQSTGLFTPAEVLRIAAVNTPQMIFPDRRIGRLEDGWEASFLVIEDDPIQQPLFAAPGGDLQEGVRAVVERIRLRVKEGHLFEAAEESSVLIEKAKRFRSLITEEKWDEARAMTAPDPRRWFAPREGEGSPWIVGPRRGPWAEWDEEFRSTSTVIGWRADDSSATVRVREINDYFRLLERGAVTNEITYFFDSEGRIDGLLIDAVGERPPGRTDEFLQWAIENEPVELRELMPDGEIDPSGDHPRRFRALLEQWRRSRN